MSIISVDFFGNLNVVPHFWEELLRLVKLDGRKVYIISGPQPHELEEKLEAKGFTKDVHYDGVYSILTYLNSKGLDIWFDESHGSWYSDNKAWWLAKARICKSIHSQVHFDSDIRFGKEFTYVATRFICTADKRGRDLAKNWLERLKIANNICNELDEDYHRMMGGITAGFVPM